MSKDKTPVLVIIFNHRFDKNIPILRTLYSHRFDKLMFIVPFYNGEDEDVIPVYESSYQFEGYIAQAYPVLRECKYSHYIFIGDDLILNPEINQDNVLNYLGVGEGDAYIESITPLKNTNTWQYSRFADADLAFRTRAVNYESEIPSLEEARNKAEEFEFTDYTIDWRIQTPPIPIRHVRTLVDSVYNRYIHPIKIEYPLFSGYSDFLVIPASKLQDFAHLFGVFAAMRLFVEIAIPTSYVLLMDRDHVRTQRDATLLTPKMWMPSDLVAQFEQNCGYATANMKECWPKEYMYLHPVKLSKWKAD